MTAGSGSDSSLPLALNRLAKRKLQRRRHPRTIHRINARSRHVARIEQERPFGATCSHHKLASMTPANESLSSQFRAATGSSDPLRLEIARADGSDRHSVSLDNSFGIIGQSRGCDVLLRDPEIGFRHAYLQMLGGRLFVVDLGTKSGISWDDGTKESGWFLPERTLNVGPFQVRIEANSPSPAGDAPEGIENPLDIFDVNEFGYSPVNAEFLDGSDRPPVRPVNRLITLVGRAPGCKFQFKDEGVSTVHCSLVRTKTGLWVVDLLGKGGTKVNRKKIRFARVDQKKLVTIGHFAMRFRFDLSFRAAGEEAVPTTAEDSSLGASAFNKVFTVARLSEALLVTPVADPSGFRYAEVHREANLVLQLLGRPDIENLIIDLGHINYFGSELIGALIRLARRANDHGGQVCFCNGSEKMRSVLRNMSLDKLWPYCDTRDEALHKIGAGREESV